MLLIYHMNACVHLPRSLQPLPEAAGGLSARRPFGCLDRHVPRHDTIDEELIRECALITVVRVLLDGDGAEF